MASSTPGPVSATVTTTVLSSRSSTATVTSTPGPPCFYGVADQVHEDLGEQVVGEDLHRLPVIVDAEVGEVGDLVKNHGMEVDGCKPGRLRAIFRMVATLS